MEDDENGWVFDSLVCFLNGPIWSAPLESYIEENSLSKDWIFHKGMLSGLWFVLVFEPNVTDNAEYRKIFNDYKNLVNIS